MSDDFTAGDFRTLAELVLDGWTQAAGRDWSVPAGSLEWTCLATADHTIDCIFSYALFLTSGCQDGGEETGSTETREMPAARLGDC